AETLGLHYVAAGSLPIRRRRCGRGFVYLDGKGRRLTDAATLARIRSLVLPPAYTDVRISDDAHAHLQATGLDEAGRLQYRYHPGWEAVREQEKLDRLVLLSRSISRIRARLARDLEAPTGSKTLALAAVVLTIDQTHIRIGCEDYVHSGRSRGAATLLKHQVRVGGDSVQFAFRGKGGHPFDCAVVSPPLARTVAGLQSLPGRRLFQYRDDKGRLYRVSSADVNAYLRQIAKAPVSAKDFRALAANAQACNSLAKLEPAGSEAGRRRQVAGVIRDVATMLGNTPAVARKSYVHHRVVEAFLCGALSGLQVRVTGRRRRGEALLDALLGADVPGGVQPGKASRAT
ncbi:MAG: DNA topoisomerase IB, partial [Alphaproteobacteria bacterium]